MADISPGSFSELVDQILGTKDYARLETEIFRPENLQYIHSEGMDLITKICEQGLAFAECNDTIGSCTRSLMHVVQIYRPKESLICLLEQSEAFVNSEKFTFLLPSLQFVMLNLPKKREKTFSWVLSTLKSHIKYFYQIPEKLKREMNANKNENLLIEQDSSVKAILQTYKDYIDFYAPFIQQLDCNSQEALASGNQEAIESICRQREYLRDYIVDLLGIPLIHFNLDWNENEVNEENQIQQETVSNSKSDARIIVEKLMSMLLVVDSNPAYYFRWLENRINIVDESKVQPKIKSGVNGNGNYNFEEEDDEEEIIVHMSSIVCYYYLIFIQGFQTQQMSSVYTPTYMFNTVIHPITTVLKNVDNTLAIHKAIKLARKFLSFCDTSASISGHINYSHRFHHNLLQKDVHRLFIDRLAYVVVYCPVKEIRADGYLLLKEYLITFDPQGKHDFLYHVFHEIPSDTLIGQMIMELKEFISIALNPQNLKYENGMEEYFLGKSATKMILSICHLKDGPTTSLCDNSDKIICTLNLLRYLLIRDKAENKTGLLEAFPKIEEIMLNPLRTAINMSRAHWELKLKELNDPHLRKEIESEETKMFQKLSCDIMIDNSAVNSGDIPYKEQKASLINAINTFDHMNGLLAWVYEAQSPKS